MQEKQGHLEKWNPGYLELNRTSLINFDNILPSDLTQAIQASIQALHKFKEDYPHYRNMIEDEFKRLATSEVREVKRLLGSDKE